MAEEKLLSGEKLLTKKSAAMPGSKAWKIQLSKAATLAVNSEFREWSLSGGKRGLDPAHKFHIVFMGTKCIVEIWLGDYDVARQTAGAVTRFDIADALSGATKNEFAGLFF